MINIFLDILNEIIMYFPQGIKVYLFNLNSQQLLLILLVGCYPLSFLESNKLYVLINAGKGNRSYAFTCREESSFLKGNMFFGH